MTIPTAGSRADAIEVFRRQKLYLSQPHAVTGLWRILTPNQREKLGGSFSETLSRRGTPIYWWAFLNQISLQRAVVELAIKLHSFSIDEAEWLLREMEELPIDQEVAQSAAIIRGDLVLIRKPPQLFWCGDAFDIDWESHQSSWNFFLTVCERAKEGEGVDRTDFGRRARNNIITQLKYRLKSVPNFPLELAESIKSVGRGTQQLQIPSDQIHVFGD